MKELIEGVLNQIRPSLVADGGDIELIDVKDGKVLVRLLGACQGCPVSKMTLKDGVERAVKAAVPEILEVVTDSNDLLKF
jgi:Fe-S cluster biogenesis protein NfuA